MAKACTHLADHVKNVRAHSTGCEDRLKTATRGCICTLRACTAATSRLMLFAGLVALAAASCTAQTPSQTPMFRGGLEHTGVYAAAGVPQLTGPKWTFHADGLLIASPVVDGDVVYLASTAGTVFALDRTTGHERWRLALKTRLTATPALANGLLYFPAFDGNFYAIDASAGKVQWKFATGGEHRFSARHLHGMQPAGEIMPDPWDSWLSSPAVWNGTVYFGSGDGNIYALDTATGTLKWKHATGDVVHASPAIADGTVFVGSWDSYFYALDAATGALKWRFKTGEDAINHNQQGIQSSAAISNGIVYFGCRDSHLYAVDERTGEKRWDYSTKGSWVLNSPAVDNGTVYFATSDTGLLFAADAQTGAIRYQVSFDKWPVYSSPAIAGTLLYVGSTQGTLSAIDTATGKIAWTFTTEASRQNLAAIKSYFAPFTTDFYDDTMGAYAKLLALGPILSSPVVVDKTIYVTSVDGNLYALE